MDRVRSPALHPDDKFSIHAKKQKHRLEAGTERWKVENNGKIWTGSLYAGSERTKMTVQFDTSSDWLVLDGDVFDVEGSLTADKVVGSKPVERKYNGTIVKGTERKDEICVDK